MAKELFPLEIVMNMERAMSGMNNAIEQDDFELMRKHFKGYEQILERVKDEKGSDYASFLDRLYIDRTSDIMQNGIMKILNEAGIV